MASGQYDMIFSINQSSSGIDYLEKNIKLAKGELLVGTNGFPQALPAGQDNDILMYQSSNASGFATINKSEIVFGGQIYAATISQSGTNAPVATVKQNTYAGTLAWKRTAVGTYWLYETSNNTIFNKTKTFIRLPNHRLTNSSSVVVRLEAVITANSYEIQFICYRIDTGALVDLATGLGIYVPIEIISYN
jgi:hypothetical protein